MCLLGPWSGPRLLSLDASSSANPSSFTSHHLNVIAVFSQLSSLNISRSSHTCMFPYPCSACPDPAWSSPCSAQPTVPCLAQLSQLIHFSFTPSASLLLALLSSCGTSVPLLQFQLLSFIAFLSFSLADPSPQLLSILSTP